VHGGLSVTTVPRTLLDIAPMIPFGRLRRALAEAEYQGLADLDEIGSVTRRGRTGSRALKRALAIHEPRLAQTLSELEERFLALCEKHALPLPEVNVKVCGLMVDAIWREERVAVELDGRKAHSSAAAIERDRDRDLTLRSAGYLVLRYTWAQVTRQARLVAADLRTALRLELTGSTPNSWA
jgi:very-short-patch-repair endonuclease